MILLQENKLHLKCLLFQIQHLYCFDAHIKKIIFISKMNQMYRFIVYIFSFIILVSCVGNKKSLIGTYVRSGKGMNNYNELILDSNNVFKFSGATCQSDYGTKGIWSRLANKLILNTFPFFRNNDSVSVLLESKKINYGDSITFEMMDDSLEMLVGVNVAVFIKNELKDGTVSDENGIVKLKYGKYDSICISYIGYSNLTIKGNESNNYYKIKMRTDNVNAEEGYNSSLSFVNETWHIGRRSYIHHRLKRVVRRIVLIDPRYKKHKKRNAYVFIKHKE